MLRQRALHGLLGRHQLRRPREQLLLRGGSVLAGLFLGPLLLDTQLLQRAVEPRAVGRHVQAALLLGGVALVRSRRAPIDRSVRLALAFTDHLAEGERLPPRLDYVRMLRRRTRVIRQVGFVFACLRRLGGFELALLLGVPLLLLCQPPKGTLSPLTRVWVLGTHVALLLVDDRGAELGRHVLDDRFVVSRIGIADLRSICLCEARVLGLRLRCIWLRV